uniref:Serpentine Receptor, class T n=1 Tax=Steinernema glaseri TaxID=37863 RepID=A0A1I7YWL2_9BILA
METPCALALHIADQPAVVSFLSFRVVLSLISAGAIVYVLKTERITKKYHPNAQILIKNHFYYNLFACINFFLVDGSDAVRLVFIRTEDKNCPIPLLPGNLAAWLKLPEVFFINALGLNLTCLGLERTVATIYAKSYEKFRRTYPCRILSFITIAVATAKSLYMFMHTEPGDWAASTTLGFIPERVQQVGLIALIGVELTNVALFIALFVRNRRWKNHSTRITASLAYKYQVEENLESLYNVLQLAFAHCAFIIAGTVVNVSLLCWAPQTVIEDFQVAFDIYVIYNCVLPFLVIWKVNQNKRTKSKKVQPSPKPADVTRDHFQILNEIFHNGVPPNKK